MTCAKYLRSAAFVLACLPAVVSGQKMLENSLPLKNWTAPMRWHPAPAEIAVRREAQFQTSVAVLSALPLDFVAITPCRLADTRGAGGNFNGMSPFSGPSIAAGATVSFPVQSPTEGITDTTPAPCGTIPSEAQAYSLNLTVVPNAGGAVNYVSVWPSGATRPFVATLDDPLGTIVSNAVIVAAGSPTGGISVFNAGPAAMDVILDMNGYYAPPPSSPFGSNSLGFFVGSGGGATCTLGSILLNASLAYPPNFIPADGRILPINQFQALFSLLGTNYGGNGVQNFALPNLASAAPNNTQYLICATGIFP